ncbi:MAG: 50S ribosomal protein L11 [Candidatus Aenigmarchaeota archaeon]|nr:50S ribosomal protein L11 [Candidatus Aenigmarchaeota archaeon]RLI96638.1 MAG: 50S ribosomal protein L11 [Candidatus Aenigmarchaeota archaeon]
MGKQTIEALVEGGKASAGPPLGPALGPLKVNVGDVIKKINEKTKAFEGMQVPVKVIVDPETKEFDVVVGTPPVSAMLKKEMGVKKLATIDEDGKKVSPGDISFETVVKIAKAKSDALAGDLKSQVKQVLGTCISGGVTVDGRNPKEIIKEIDEGKYDEKLK